MTPTLITAKNGKARPKNPYPKSVLLENEPRIWGINPKWKDFESAVQWHDCPEATEDGEYWGELVWQSRMKYEWCDEPTDFEWQDISAPIPNMLTTDYRQIWRIVPQPQEKQTNMKTDFQSRVLDWLIKCFGIKISKDILERNDRFIEEALELTQSLNYSAERAHALVDYVYGRDKGEPFQEVGGVMVTLAALCSATGLNMMIDGETEFARIDTPEMIEKIRKKQASKPVGSALPIPVPKKEEAKTVEGKTAEHTLIDEIIDSTNLGDTNRDIVFRSFWMLFDPSPAKSIICRAMQTYSSQQNTAMMEENARLRKTIQWVIDNSINNKHIVDGCFKVLNQKD